MKIAHLAALALGLAGLGCEPEYELELDAVSTTAPNLTTHYVEERERTSSKITSRSLVISRGAAIALRCKRRSDPCEGLRVESVEPTVATALRGGRAFETKSETANRYGSRISASGGSNALVVIVGTKIGTTRVRLDDDDGSATIDVTVIDAPAP